MFSPLCNCEGADVSLQIHSCDFPELLRKSLVEPNNMTQAHLELWLTTLKKMLIQFSEDDLFMQWPVPKAGLYSSLYIYFILPLIGKYVSFSVLLALI